MQQRSTLITQFKVKLRYWSQNDPPYDIPVFMADYADKLIGIALKQLRRG